MRLHWRSASGWPARRCHPDDQEDCGDADSRAGRGAAGNVPGSGSGDDRTAGLGSRAGGRAGTQSGRSDRASYGRRLTRSTGSLLALAARCWHRAAMRIAVFLGSSSGRRPEYAATAAEVGRLLAAAGIGLVYGGGSVGLMGVRADAALAAGGEVIGVIPDRVFAAEVAHQGLTRLEVVGSMHARKARMAQLADAFAVLPGGLGTMDELFEILTWRQIGLHDKPVALVDAGDFWDPLIAVVDALVEDEFVGPASREFVLRVQPWQLADLVRGRPGG